MRLLLVGATEVRNSDATLLLAKALAAAGCSVKVVPVADDLPPLASIGLAQGWTGDPAYMAAFNRHLLALADDFGPDVVFLYGSNWCVSPRTLRRLRRRHGCSIVLWEVNQRIVGSLQAATIPLYDYVFVLDSHFVPVLLVAGARKVEHLPACADPDEHRPVPLSSDEERWYAGDVAFIGTHSEDRAALLARLAHTDLRIYGTGWDGVGPRLEGRVRREPVYGLKKAKIYSGARVCLNVHQPHMVAGENFRVFEVAACGGLSVSAPKPDLLACFEPGREVVVFDGAHDLVATVEHHLANPDQRDEIAEAARRRVSAEHTYHHRARTILDRITQE
jgi:spore maturation protein CgeB